MITMASPNPFVHPRWGLTFHWWAVDPSGEVALIYSAFGPVPWEANAQVQVMDSATKAARASYPGWFTEAKPTGLAPHRFEWDEECDDHYTRVDSPALPVLVTDLPDKIAQAARLVRVTLSFRDITRIDLAYPDGEEALSAR